MNVWHLPKTIACQELVAPILKVDTAVLVLMATLHLISDVTITMNVLWATMIVVLAALFVSTNLVATVVMDVQRDFMLIQMEIAVMVRCSYELLFDMTNCHFTLSYKIYTVHT